MKKVLFMLCGLLPGGCVLVVMALLFVGCANYQYQSSRLASSSSYRGAPPPGMMLEDAMAYDITQKRDVENDAIRACIDDTRKCQAMQMFAMGTYGIGGLDIQYGYTVAGIQAVQAFQQASSTVPTAPPKKQKHKQRKVMKTTTKTTKKGKK